MTLKSRRLLFVLLTVLLMLPCVAFASVSVSKCRITLETGDFIYNGEAYEPAVTVTYKNEPLTEGEDYTVEYSNNILPGKGVVTVTGAGKYSGSAKKRFVIGKAENTLEAADLTATWSEKKQTLQITAVTGTEAKLTYHSGSDSVKVSRTGEVTVAAKYIGQATVKITAAETDLTNRLSITITVTVVPETPVISAMVGGGKGRAQAAWSECGGCTGYELQMASDSDFTDARTLTLDKKETVTGGIMGFERESTVYARVRSFKKTKKNIWYSDWSETQSTVLPLAVVAFGSDYQSNDWQFADKIYPALLAQLSSLGYMPDQFIFCGDYSVENGNYGIDPGPILPKLREFYQKAFPDADAENDMIFIQGNHEKWNDALINNGLYDYGSYLVYVMNTETMNPWQQGIDKKKDIVVAASQQLDACLTELIENGETRPVIIATHVPLHFTEWDVWAGDNVYAHYFLDVLNKAGDKLDIIYLFGHNHANKLGDRNIGAACICLLPGETIMVPDDSKLRDNGTIDADAYYPDTVNFIYMTAGYVGYTDGQVNPDHNQTIGVMLLYSDHITLLRCAQDGIHRVGASGMVNLGTMMPKSYRSFVVPAMYTFTRKYLLAEGETQHLQAEDAEW